MAYLEYVSSNLDGVISVYFLTTLAGTERGIAPNRPLKVKRA